MMFHKIKYIWFVIAMKFTSFLPDFQPIMRFRGVLVRPSLKKCGVNFQICSQVVIIGGHNLSIGKDVFIAHGCWLSAYGGVTLDDEVMLAPYTVIVTGNHIKEDGSYRFGKPDKRNPVYIGRGSWVGAGVKIMPGVTIGEGSVCAAGSVITKDVASNTIVVGVPAKKLRRSGDE